MSKARLHPSLLEFQGAMGDMVFKKRGKKVYVSIKPKAGASGEPSEAQRAQRKVFRKAVSYATSALADETARAFYQALAEVKETPARALCIKDYLKAPTMDDLDLSKYKGQVGDRILITTYDDIGVVEVNVELTRSDGTRIEAGKAVELGTGSGNWEYVATAPVAPGTDLFIEAEAFDRPGHRTVASANPIVGESN
jgi:hypothetical protein